MKVTNNPVGSPSIERAHETLKKTNTPVDPGLKKETGNTSGANVEISEEAKFRKQAMDIAKSAPDIRKDRVAELKKSIANGSYKVDSRAVADRLVDDHLQFDFGKNHL